MNEFFEIKNFKATVENKAYNDPLNKCAARMLKRITNIVEENKILFVYPKGLLAIDELNQNINNPDALEIIVITEDLHFIIAKAIDGGKKTEICIKKKDEISQIMLNAELSDYKDARNIAHIIFKDQQDIELNYAKDGNHYWEETYSNIIGEIIKAII